MNDCGEICEGDRRMEALRRWVWALAAWHLRYAPVPNSLEPHLRPERTWYNSSQLGASATLRTPTWHLRIVGRLAIAWCSG
jgi:hypothetical protein